MEVVFFSLSNYWEEAFIILVANDFPQHFNRNVLNIWLCILRFEKITNRCEIMDERFCVRCVVSYSTILWRIFFWWFGRVFWWNQIWFGRWSVFRCFLLLVNVEVKLMGNLLGDDFDHKPQIQQLYFLSYTWCIMNFFCEKWVLFWRRITLMIMHIIQIWLWLFCHPC